MPPASDDLFLHPVRMRILLALSGVQLTARQLVAALRDVPQATLYRHLNALAAGGALSVVAERPVRGTREKVYALAGEPSARVDGARLRRLTKADHLRMFTAFVTTLLGDFTEYVRRRRKVDPAADGVGYHRRSLYLSDQELHELSAAMQALLAPALAHGPSPDRRRRIFATVVLPAPEPPAVDE